MSITNTCTKVCKSLDRIIYTFFTLLTPLMFQCRADAFENKRMTLFVKRSGQCLKLYDISYCPVDCTETINFRKRQKKKLFQMYRTHEQV